jgi:hypothetical protein
MQFVDIIKVTNHTFKLQEVQVIHVIYVQLWTKDLLKTPFKPLKHVHN